MRDPDSVAFMITRAVAVLAVLAGSIVVLTGCSASIDDIVDRSLERSVEDAQDSFWPYRDKIASDPESTLADLDFVADFRSGESEGASILLLGVADSSDGPTLTLLGTGGAQTGGGWWYDQADAAVCFALSFPTDEKMILTSRAECPPGAPVDEYDSVVPLDDLNPRLVVTAADYPPSICQCYSGSVCDCPGG